MEPEQDWWSGTEHVLPSGTHFYWTMRDDIGILSIQLPAKDGGATALDDCSKAINECRARFGAAYREGKLRRWCDECEAVQPVTFRPKYIIISLSYVEEQRYVTKPGFVFPAADVLGDESTSNKTLGAIFMLDMAAEAFESGQKSGTRGPSERDEEPISMQEFISRFLSNVGEESG